LELTGATGKKVRCLLRRPADVREPLPAVLLAAGYETGRRAAKIPEIPFPIIMISCDYPYHGPAKLSKFDLLKRIFQIRTAVLDTPGSLLVATQYLTQRPEVDRERILAVGASIGALAITAVASGEPRVRAVALLYGGGDIGTLIATNYSPGPWPVSRAIAEAAAILLAPIEPTKYVGLIAPRPLLMVNGPHDLYIPRSSIEALYRAARDPKEIQWVPLGHLEAFYEEDALKRMAELTIQWFARLGIIQADAPVSSRRDPEAAQETVFGPPRWEALNPSRT